MRIQPKSKLMKHEAEAIANRPSPSVNAITPKAIPVNNKMHITMVKKVSAELDSEFFDLVIKNAWRVITDRH